MSKIAILGAMVEEIEPILSRVENINKISYANNTFYEATYKGKEVVIAYSKIGKVFSTLTATLLIEKFGCDMLLFSGVAGGISPELAIGDLIIADGLCQHDLDITAFGHPYGYVPEGEVCIPTDVKLREIAKEVARTKGMTLKEGIIATGDQFVACNEKKGWIEETFKADALEMEGASVAVVCHALNIPFFILRAISDTADMDAGFDFDTFLASSAKVSADFILEMVERV
ncbi:MAG TPA: 5'-methylthioadenosine/adenosylhomocysteine nucleosidase [Sulfurovum sp.]|nr:MAG: 5'-methylthioadenosine/S-adenosylhomocysteine nucleosidase [Sulfurovum sp. 35-42-20]OYZ26050.1 MAG: 5'-methylthioadenosine/S-adenosylhomocysteine nucleosidase [Sulfurovum sp. 16-42-52]OYZ50440.1 MAG: 5'-methylthioadenosine/S-adenosylhomocysteine nucleosidase [Sulfurovum sp. 24-42-9]OZA60327.1 MAG: 5'-methylthioadenosine/S-adenosylhomocysteine nucleosidase [Sulfurovum sp. 39-42-12]HQR73354.1 5'-methylthioadenosine/adenosylhomocysteine nucleosidase [Sulfurovum sp.]